MFTDIRNPPLEDWEVRISSVSRRICSSFKWGTIPMYQIAFEHMGYRMPFTDFEMAVFYNLELSPSQLLPNYLAFIQAFEITTSHLEIVPTILLFFHTFHLQRSRPKGEVANKFGWVSLKQNKRLFEMYEESVRGFKEKYYLVLPITSAGWRSIVTRGPKYDDNRNVVVGPNGEPEMEDYARLHFHWTQGHYLRPTNNFIFKKSTLSQDEAADYDRLIEFF
ncbi:hypothetical protein A2U01_0027542, partial [Trifolium medium]|nr:hypothetical protein [Trifolium medium]